MKYSSIVAVFIFVFSMTCFATVPPISGTVPEHLRPQLAKIQSEYNTGYWAERFAQRAEMLQSGLLDRTAITIDTVNAPVLMGTYSNSVGKHSTQVFQEMLFDGPNPTGTLTDFYTENSYGKLFMSGKVFGWFPTPRTFDYYVHDGGTRNAGLVYGGPDFTIDLIVESDKTVDFSKFVKYVDSEGAHVPYVAIIHTGSDAASGGDNIWSHRWNVRWRFLQRKNSGSDPYFDLSKVTAAGRYITNDLYNGLPVIIDGDYAIQPEFSGSSNASGNPKPIGVFVHEFGHIFGLPDLYDTDNSSAGLGNWCLMAGGSYGGDGSHEATPAHMSAWCKVTLNWITPTLVTSLMKNQPIKNVNRNPEIFKLNVRNTPGGEYFLVENRQKIGFDQYLLGSGLLIFHIDPSRTSNSNENRRLVDMEQADGLRHLNTTTGRGDAGDPYPGSTGNRTFDGYSSPNSTDYSLLQSYASVRNISDSDTIMYADLDVGTIPHIMVRTFQAFETGTSNNNGRIDPGETGSLAIKLENVNPASLTNGKIKVESMTADVVIDTTSRNISLAGLDTVSVFFTSSISVLQNAAPRKIVLVVSVQTPQQLFQKSYEIFIGYPKILLMNLDSIAGDNIAAYYENAITDLQKHSETVSELSKTLGNAKLANRNVVILFSGRKTFNIISDSIGNVLQSFLNSGGQLFMSGQNIAEDIKKRDSQFGVSLLRASWSKNILFGRNLYGIGSDLFGTQLPFMSVTSGNGAKNQTSPDELIVDTTLAHPSFIWNSASGTAYGGVWWGNPSTGAKIVFWSFGFEAINDSAAGGSSRKQAMTAVLNYLNGVTSAPDYSNLNGIPREFALRSNFPNPFNPSTTINYSIPKESNVSLKIYDMLGKLVAVLVNEKQNNGDYSVPFDASRLSSGIYIYQLRAGNYVQTKKMTLIK